MVVLLTGKEPSQLDGLRFHVSRRYGHAVRIASPRHGVIRENPRIRGRGVRASRAGETSPLDRRQITSFCTAHVPRSVR